LCAKHTQTVALALTSISARRTLQPSLGLHAASQNENERTVTKPLGHGVIQRQTRLQAACGCFAASLAAVLRSQHELDSAPTWIGDPSALWTART